MKKQIIDLRSEGKIRDYDDYVVKGNSLACVINGQVTLWRINLECDGVPEKTPYKMKNVKMCSILAVNDFQGQECLVISQD